MQLIVRKRGYWLPPLASLALAVLALALVAIASATPPSTFMEGGTAGGDANVRDQNDSTDPPFDWANTNDGTPTNTCPAAATGFTVVNLSGGGGLFNCGQGNGQFTTPIAPVPTAAGTVGTNNIDQIAFKVDPLSSDEDTCINAKTGLQTLDGDPTTYTGAGGEKNGDSLVIDSTGANAVETWSTSSTPPKDDVNNVYAVSRTHSTSGTVDLREIFFGAERVVNNGDTHIDFEFTQAGVSLSPGSPPGTCAGKFNGHRTQGDFIASIDYTLGGTLGTFALSRWHCDLDTHSADNSTGWVTDTVANPNSDNGTACDFAAGTGSSAGSGVQAGTGPHYQEIVCVDADLTDNVDCPPISFVGGGTPPPTDAIRAVTNAGGPVPCGGWACRDGSGNVVTTIDTNELMEGGVNLLSLGFTGCISTFIPHTRSSGSFSATLKDFEVIPFNTCSGALSVKKVFDDTTTLLPGACFTIVVTGTSTPADAITNPICDDDSQDKDPTDGVICVDGVAAASYTVTEVTPPAGYIGDPTPQTGSIGPFTTIVSCPSASRTFTFANTLGSIQWEKRSDIDGTLQADATFNITPNPYDCHVPVDANPSTISDDADGTDGPAGPGDEDGTGGQLKLDLVCVTNLDGTARTYTITEASAKTGFAIDPDPNRDVPISRTDANPVIGTQGTNTTGKDDCPDVTGIPDANHTLGSAGTGADFCNPVGSLFWEKRAKDAGVGGTPLLGGATFSVTPNPHTGSGSLTGIIDCRVPAVHTNCNALEDKDPDAGQFCLDAVLLNTGLTVTETAAPANYVKDGTSRTVTLTTSSTCASGPTDLGSAGSPTGDFINIPLSQIRVIFTSLGGANVTKASIVCADSTPATVPANSENGDPELAITGNTAANPTVVTTSAAHGLIDGDVVQIIGSNSTPSIDGTFIVDELTPTTFSIPVNVTVAGSAGTVKPFDDTDETFGNGTTTLLPGTYTCTVVIDP